MCEAKTDAHHFVCRVPVYVHLQVTNFSDNLYFGFIEEASTINYYELLIMTCRCPQRSSQILRMKNLP
jgi:hypothetical protein